MKNDKTIGFIIQNVWMLGTTGIHGEEYTVDENFDVYISPSFLLGSRQFVGKDSGEIMTVDGFVNMLVSKKNKEAMLSIGEACYVIDHLDQVIPVGSREYALAKLSPRDTALLEIYDLEELYVLAPAVCEDGIFVRRDREERRKIWSSLGLNE